MFGSLWPVSGPEMVSLYEILWNEPKCLPAEGYFDKCADQDLVAVRKIAMSDQIVLFGMCVGVQLWQIVTMWPSPNFHA